MRAHLINSRILRLIIVTFIVLLTASIYIYPLFKPLPSGADAIIYINDVRWIINNQTLPRPYQSTYHSFAAYPSSGTDINLSVISLITGLDIVFPLFHIYQLFLIFLIIGTSYLVGKIYGEKVSLLFPLMLLCSFSIIRLFVGSTLSNLLAFAYVNIIFYCVHRYLIHRSRNMLYLIALFLVNLFITHGYLTAPIFIPFFIFYSFFLLVINQRARDQSISFFRRINRLFLIFLVVIILSVLGYLGYFYHGLYKEAANAFFHESVNDKFRGAILFSQYGAYLGRFIFSFGVLGIFLYVVQWRKNLKTFLIFPLMWIVALLLLLQTYRFGIDFYYERILFLTGVFIALMAAYGINAFVELMRLKSIRIVILVITFMTVLVVQNGVFYIKALYDSSNLIQDEQIVALRILKERLTDTKGRIFSHQNGVSQTGHDIMLVNADITYISTISKSCMPEDKSCAAFNNPERSSSNEYFREHDVRYFLFMKPSSEGNEILDALIKRYDMDQNFSVLYNSPNVWLFSVNEPHS